MNDTTGDVFMGQIKQAGFKSDRQKKFFEINLKALDWSYVQE